MRAVSTATSTSSAARLHLLHDEAAFAMVRAGEVGRGSTGITPALVGHGARLTLSVVLIFVAPLAFAGPIFQVTGGNVLERFDRSSSGFVSDGSHISGFTTDPSGGVVSSGSFNSFAAAGPGGLHVDADSKVANTSPAGAGGTNSADANAHMTLDDVIISGPVGPLTTSYSMHLSGTLAAFNDSQATSGASATVVVQLLGNGHLLNDSSATKNSGVPQYGVDLLQNFTGSNDLVSAPFTVMANQAFTVIVHLAALARSTQGSGDTGSVSADVHFSNTLTFVTGGPVFNLPAGYTANSISGNVVNNRFVPIADDDIDGIAAESDNCPSFANSGQADTDADRRGDACECTDQDGNGRNTVSDLVAINAAIFNPALATPLCDGNNDGKCDVRDIIAANVEIFSPTNTSTCARQPVPGP